MKKMLSLEEIYNKNFYIIDCENFIYYPKIVKIIAEKVSSEHGISYITNENKKVCIEELKRFKNLEEAYKEAKRLNDLPKNKKRADEWNDPKEIFRRKSMEAILKD